MATATLSPDPRLQFIDGNGDPISGALIYTYSAGTTSLAFTYSTPVVSVPTRNANPVVCDENGRCIIYLVPGSSYKFVVHDALDQLVYTQDNVAAVGNAATAANQHGVVQGRLTLTTALPVTTADVTAATAVLFTPYLGNQISLFDGAAWALYQFSELSLSITGFAANTNFDMFASPSSATAALSAVAWTNATTRATALTTQDGALVKTGDTTALYLGTFRTTGTVGQTEDSAAKRFLFNYYNRAPRILQVVDATASWAYNTATFRQANGAAANQVVMVIGWAEVMVNLTLKAKAASDGNGSVGVALTVGIGYDSTTTPTSPSEFGPVNQVANNTAPLAWTTGLNHYPAVGLHTYVWLEKGPGTGGASTNWYSSSLSGLFGSTQG